MTLVTLVVGLAGAGAVAGLLAGLLGVGGGIVIVPVLYTLFTLLDLAPHVRMPLAVGTSLSTIIVTAWVSSRAHWRRASVDLDLLRSFAPWIVVGVPVGSLVAAFAPAGAMVLVFAVVALAVALYMGLAPGDAGLARAVPVGPVRWLAATTIGALSSIMGLGGGTLGVPTLTLMGVPVRRAVGTGAAFGVVIAVPATVGMILAGWGDAELPVASLGFVNLLGFVVLVPMTVAMAPLGAALAHKIPPPLLRRAFAMFLLITSMRMFMGHFGAA